MSVIKHDGRPRSFHDSGDRGIGCRSQEAEASRSKNMAKSLTRQTFGVPSQGVLELIETSDKVARLSEAGYAYETKLRALEHQFEVHASDLQEEYIAEVLEIHTAETAK
jgi:hypothetical protein